MSLLDLALGTVAEQGRAVPVKVVGYEPGYEEQPYPGLYDPRYSGDVSPLINSLEARRTRTRCPAATSTAPRAGQS
ncbi:hypothetical protein [Streptomyces sp. NPDC002994]|uniref:hypothetical protein n=1 Tax=Streptomyces sp. NPDC002994 TaxID=3154441 RepID=UPI0033A7085E